jgi:hypothetical protein
MKIDLNPRLGDSIPNVLWESHELGNIIKATNSIPCSECNAIHQSGIDNFTRNHFHISSDFGGCMRKTFLICTTGKRSGMSGFTFLNDGHIHEAAMLQSVQAGLPEGYNLKIAENGIEGRFNFNNYYMIGHVDALLTTPYGIYGAECKAIKDVMWKKIIDNSEINDDWYGQCQGYMITWQLDRWYLIVKNRHTSKILIPIRIDRDEEFIVNRLVKLDEVYTRIMSGHEQPQREHISSKDYECQYCPFGNNIGDGSCWRTDPKQIEFEIK